jgi:hypothetical protein
MVPRRHDRPHRVRGKVIVQRIGHRPHKARGVRAQRIQRRQFLWFLTAGAGVVVASGALVWMAPVPPRPLQQRASNGDLLEIAPPGQLPSFAQQASPKVQEVYRYAVGHGETLRYIPCFCGCARLGHRHNGECYVAERLPGVHITFTNHGAT